MANEKSLNKCTVFNCVTCSYITANKKDYSKHIITAKHLRLTNANCEANENPIHNTKHVCKCGKIYNHASSLCKHRKHCISVDDDDIENIEPSNTQPTPKSDEIMTLLVELIRTKTQQDKPDQTQLIIELVKQNTEFKELLIEQNKQMMDLAKNAGNNNNNTNCNNKFNLNVFLNETCKDAITLDDFINSIEVTREEFIDTGNVGFVNGISNVMLKRIKNMELHTRPLHCTDLKRETIYIKQDDKWEKEDNDKTHLRKAVKTVAHRNMNEMKRWYHDNKPEVDTNGTDEYENYFKYYKSALGGYDKEEDVVFEDKIIKNVLKEVVLDKTSAIQV